jgi:hypothetical protein
MGLRWVGSPIGPLLALYTKLRPKYLPFLRVLRVRCSRWNVASKMEPDGHTLGC